MKAKKSLGLATIAALSLVLSACGGGFDEGDGGNGGTTDGGTSTDGGSTGAGEANDNTVEVLIGASGPAVQEAVTQAVADWSAESGIPAEVIPASDLAQQLSQGFAGDNLPDLFYLSADQLYT